MLLLEEGQLPIIKVLSFTKYMLLPWYKMLKSSREDNYLRIGLVIDI